MTLNSPQFTLTSTPEDPAAPDVGSGVEEPPAIDYPPDDDGTTVVDDTTPGGD